MSTPDISFTKNWNGKLFCNCFTTIRLFNDKKYHIGKEYTIRLNGHNSGTAVICDIKHFYLKDLTDFMALLDTGYNRQEAAQIFKRMYAKVVTNWEKQVFSFILLRRVQQDIALRDQNKNVLQYKDNKTKAA